MSSSNQVNGRTDLVAKDAMYLFELMRDSPHPFLLHIGPYAEKTGTKPNSIIKRLGEIKKRNGLNIVTTTNAPGDNRSYTTPRPRQSAIQNDNVARPVGVKRERKPKPNTPKASNGNNGVKTEDTPTPAELHNLPTPATSPAATTPSSPPPTNLIGSAMNKPAFANPPAPILVNPLTQVPMQMPAYMPQKRTLNDMGGDHYANGEANVLKKVKTETWSFS
ncbi:hypothetical protein H2200_010736 [Cladophialophora chaetospira]|uniref:Uncharacterized protein n=1 Tax=Cladophialophora chaetospira TaxID=386627 RepID=A0AA38X0T3_9EURO|nr:hypothetical protein H2200_010736 [Cladophialophora chaetospira]